MSLSGVGLAVGGVKEVYCTVYLRQAAMNNIIHHALTMTIVGVPAKLEPPGLPHSDGKHRAGRLF